VSVFVVIVVVDVECASDSWLTSSSVIVSWKGAKAARSISSSSISSSYRAPS
jgi:hypothetical protein